MRLIHQETMAEKVDFNPTSVFTDLPPICPELGLSKKIFSKWENKKHDIFFIIYVLHIGLGKYCIYFNIHSKSVFYPIL